MILFMITVRNRKLGPPVGGVWATTTSSYSRIWPSPNCDWSPPISPRRGTRRPRNGTIFRAPSKRGRHARASRCPPSERCVCARAHLERRCNHAGRERPDCLLVQPQRQRRALLRERRRQRRAQTDVDRRLGAKPILVARRNEDRVLPRPRRRRTLAHLGDERRRQRPNAA